MLQKAAFRIYLGNLKLFCIQEVSNVVVSLNIKLCKVLIIGYIVNTFPGYKTVDHAANIAICLLPHFLA